MHTLLQGATSGETITMLSLPELEGFISFLARLLGDLRVVGE